MSHSALGDSNLSADTRPQQESSETPAAKGSITETAEARTIKYFMPEAGEVTLVWGVNNWATVPELMRPTGTRVIDGVMRSPMRRQDGTFEVGINVPVGSSLDHGFLITGARDGRPVNVWIKHPNEGILIALFALSLILILIAPLVRRGYAPIRHWVIHIDSAQIKRIALWLGCVNLFLVGSTGVFSYLVRHSEEPGSASPFLKYASVQLNLGAENNLATWYSSTLFFSVAIVAVYCCIADYGGKVSKVQRGPAAGWLVIAAIFALLSLDEMGSIHERIGVISSSAPGGEARGWVEALKVPITLCGTLMILYSYLRLGVNRKALALAIIGTAFFLMNPFLEIGEFSILESSRAISYRWLHDLYLAVEEGAELFGALAWFTGLLIYLSAHTTYLNVDDTTATKCELQMRRVLTAVPVMYVAVLLGTELFVRFTLPGDTGIPRDWFAATLVLLSFGLWWSRFGNVQAVEGDSAGAGYSSFSVAAVLVTALSISVACGVNLPAYLPDGTLPVYLFLSFVALHVFYLGWFGMRNEWLSRLVIGVILALILSITLIVNVDLLPIPIGLAYAVVFLSLTFSPFGRQHGREA